MPFYSEHIANMYYSGAPTYTGASYGYSGTGSSYSAPYLSSGSSYSTHSSLGGYSRAPLTTRWITSSGRNYSPMLSTISERGTTSPVRINSPRRIPLMKRSYGTPSYTPRPININTADIDVSRNKYHHKTKSPSPVSPKISPLRETIDKDKTSPPKEIVDAVQDSSPFMPRVDGKPETGIDSSPGKQRSTIKRGRTVVRLHTIKRKDKDSPRKTNDNLENEDTKDNTTVADQVENDQSDSIKWREKLADDLIYNDKREKKSLGTKLAEKFLVKEKDNDEVLPRKWEPHQIAENSPMTSTENRESTASKFPDRRCSMELLEEQANLLDSLIKSENLSTATLDLTKVGVEEESHTSLDTYQSIKRRKSNHKNPLKTTKSDNSLHDSLRSFRDQKQLSKRRSLKKSSSGGSICRLDSITEMPKEPIANNLPAIEEIEKRLSVKQLESAKPKIKPKTIPKITSTVEITAPVSPLKFKIENVTVEEIPRVHKKEITYSSAVIEEDNVKEVGSGKKTKDQTIFTFETSDKSIKPSKRNLPSPEPDDGNFWDKIGKRETVYLLKRKQNLEENKEKQRRALFWFPEEDDEEKINNSEMNISTQKEAMTMSYRPQDKNDSIYQECSDITTIPNEIHKVQKPDNSSNMCKDNVQISQINLNINAAEKQREEVVLFKTALETPSNINNASHVIEKLPSLLNENDSVPTEVKQNYILKQNTSIVPETTSEPHKVKDHILIETGKKETKIHEIKEETNQALAVTTMVKNHASELQDKTTNVTTFMDPFKDDFISNNTKKNIDSSDKTDESKLICAEIQLDTTTSINENKSTSDNSDNKTIVEIDKTAPDVIKDAIEDVEKPSNLKNINNKSKAVETKSITTVKSKQIELNNKKTSPKNKDTLIQKSSENRSIEKKYVEKEKSLKRVPNIIESKSNVVIEGSIKKVTKPEKSSNSDNIPVKVNVSNIDREKAGEDNKADTPLQKDQQEVVESNKKSVEKDIKEDNINVDKVNPKSIIEENIAIISDDTNKIDAQQIDPNSENMVTTPPKDDQVVTKMSVKEENVDVEDKKEEVKPKDVVKLPTAPIVKKPVKEEAAIRPLIATPRPLQKKAPQVIHSSSSSETSSDEEDSSDDEEEEESDSSEGSAEFFECENNTDGRTSTGSNDSGFDSSAPTSPAGFVQIKKGADSPGPSAGATPTKSDTPDISERELEQSTAYGIFRKTGRFTPPARSIPRFRKYTVEDFQFIKVLGKGSFGKVLLAELKDTEYYYAVKCLKKDVVLEDDDVECTLIERKVLALGTNHPYLCHLFATFQTDSHLFFVMEYLNGGDLMFHIQQSGRFPEARARFYAAEIVSGLKFLHKRGIVYRDLKLDNILLDFDGHVRIADFGMCKLQIYLDKTADTFCGTPDYMAPEIIKGLKYNQAVDWWSFGVLLYEMLIGQSPFSGCDEDELFWSICNEMPSYPRFLSQQALTILTRLLDKDASSRLGGVECMHGDVRDQDFFHQIHWDRLERRELDAPFKPRVRHPLDTQYFDRAFTGERPRLTAVEPQVLRSMDQGPFRGFSYTNPNATDR